MPNPNPNPNPNSQEDLESDEVAEAMERNAQWEAEEENAMKRQRREVLSTPTLTLFPEPQPTSKVASQLRLEPLGMDRNRSRLWLIQGEAEKAGRP